MRRMALVAALDRLSLMTASKRSKRTAAMIKVQARASMHHRKARVSNGPPMRGSRTHRKGKRRQSLQRKNAGRAPTGQTSGWKMCRSFRAKEHLIDEHEPNLARFQTSSFGSSRIFRNGVRLPIDSGSTQRVGSPAARLILEPGPKNDSRRNDVVAKGRVHTEGFVCPGYPEVGSVLYVHRPFQRMQECYGNHFVVC